MNTHKDAPRSGKSGPRDRYWSLMLVGEHGRIVPIRHIKGLTIFFIGLLVIAILSLAILTFFYIRQSRAFDQVQSELAEVRQKLSMLRDEKDILLAKLVIENKIPQEKQKSIPVPEAEDEKDEVALETPPQAAPPASSPEIKTNKPDPPAPAPEPAPTVQWGASIRQFDVSYQPERSILKARFRIYNASKPHQPLAGRIVVIFKKLDDTPIKWLTVPRVKLTDSMPSGKTGQAFKIRNYRTMEFKAFGLKPPIHYDTAAVFVFTAEGEMILNQDFSFKVDVPPPPPPQPKPSPVKPAVEKKPASEPPKPTQDQQPGRTLFPYSPPGAGSKLPPILQDTTPLPTQSPPAAIETPEENRSQEESKPPQSPPQPTTDSDQKTAIPQSGDPAQPEGDQNSERRP